MDRLARPITTIRERTAMARGERQSELDLAAAQTLGMRGPPPDWAETQRIWFETQTVGVREDVGGATRLVERGSWAWTGDREEDGAEEDEAEPGRRSRRRWWREG